MPDTYNVQERSFIKKPEAKVCAACGQPIAPDVKPLHNKMTQYKDPISGNHVVVNGDAKAIDVKGVKMYELGSQELIDATAALAGEALQAPAGSSATKVGDTGKIAGQIVTTPKPAVLIPTSSAPPK